jgi:hypothetical protein
MRGYPSLVLASMCIPMVSFRRLFNNVFNKDYMVSDDRMTEDEFKKIWMGPVVAYSRLLS